MVTEARECMAGLGQRGHWQLTLGFAEVGLWDQFWFSSQATPGGMQALAAGTAGLNSDPV